MPCASFPVSVPASAVSPLETPLFVSATLPASAFVGLASSVCCGLIVPVSLALSSPVVKGAPPHATQKTKGSSASVFIPHHILFLHLDILL